jgi:hypothetical protein
MMTLFLDSGASLVLTAVLAHGYGCFMYLALEGMGAGSNWNIECATCLKILWGVSGVSVGL